MKEQASNKEDCGCQHEPVKMEHGGMFKGPSHDDGGIPVVVADTGQEVEVEGKEVLIPHKCLSDDTIRTRAGTNMQILDAILKKVNLSTKDKATVVEGGDVVICIRSAHDKTKRSYTGTDAQIVSAVNASGGCKIIEQGAEVVEMRDGGSIFKFYWRYKNIGAGETEKMGKTKMLSKADALKFIADNQDKIDTGILYDASTKKLAATYLENRLNLVSPELNPQPVELQHNSKGGYDYKGPAKQTAEKVGLITLPKDIPGTNCTNCIFFKDGFCDNKYILLPVNKRMCCSYWDEKSIGSAITNLENADFFPDKKHKDYKINDQGGYIYTGDELKRAQNADLITLPKNIEGTTCGIGNCKWNDGNNLCFHPKILLPITDRMSCSLWDNNEVKRSWGEMKEILYKEGGTIPERYKALGFSRVGQKLKSTQPHKKWMVLAKQGQHYKVVHGGEKGMQDFSQHHDKQRQKRFWQRMGGYDSEKSRNSFSPLYWHKKFGTWAEGGEVYSELQKEYKFNEGGELYKQGTIKVAWIGKDPDILESKMYHDIETALQESKDKQYLVFELDYSDNDYYRWRLLPYGMYNVYKISETLNKEVNMENLMKEGGQIDFKNEKLKVFRSNLNMPTYELEGGRTIKELNEQGWNINERDIERLKSDGKVTIPSGNGKNSIQIIYQKVMKEGGNIPQSAIEEGKKVELEHKDTIAAIKNNPDISVEKAAEMIAKDHLKESPDYYTKLKVMESRLEQGSSIEKGYSVFKDVHGIHPQIGDLIIDDTKTVGKIISFYETDYKYTTNSYRMVVDFRDKILELNPSSEFEIIKNPDQKIKEAFKNIKPVAYKEGGKTPMQNTWDIIEDAIKNKKQVEYYYPTRRQRKIGIPVSIQEGPPDQGYSLVIIKNFSGTEHTVKDYNIIGYYAEGGNIQNENKNTMKEFYTELCNAQGDILGCKRLETGTKVTDKKTNIVSEIIDIREDKFVLKPIGTFSVRNTEPFEITFKEFQQSFRDNLIDIEGFEHTDEDNRLLHQLLKDYLQLEMIQQMKEGAMIDRNFKVGDIIKHLPTGKQYVVTHPIPLHQHMYNYPVLEAIDLTGQEIVVPITEVEKVKKSKQVTNVKTATVLDSHPTLAKKQVIIVKDYGQLVKVEYYDASQGKFVGDILEKKDLDFQYKEGGTMQFESGATTLVADDLIHHIDNTPELTNKKNELYEQAYHSGFDRDILYKTFKNAFSYQAEKDFNRSPYSTYKIALSDYQRGDFANALTDEFTLWKIDNDIELQEGGPVREGMWVNMYDTLGEANRCVTFLSEKTGQKYEALPSSYEEGKWDVMLYKPMMKGGGQVPKETLEKFIAANNLTGQNTAVKFRGDNTIYYTKNVSPDRTYIFVISEAGVVKNKPIKDIVMVENRNVSVYDLQFCEGGAMGEKGEVIRISKDMPYMASLSNLTGKDLHVIDTKVVNFASGDQKYYIVEVDGEKYEVPERFTEHKLQEGGRMSEEIQPVDSIIDQMRKNIELFEEKIQDPATPVAQKETLQKRLDYLNKTVSAYDAARNARKAPIKTISVTTEPVMEEPTQIRTPVGTVETIREANMPVVMDVTPTDSSQYYIILDANTRQKVKDALYYRKIKYSSIVLPDHRTKLIVTGSSNLNEAYAFYEKFRQKKGEQPESRETITGLHAQPISAQARMVMAQPVSAGETMKQGGRFRMCPVGTEIQTLILSKDAFPNEMKARKWLNEHGFKHTKVDKKENTLRYRQQPPSHFIDKSERTITITKGVQAVIGCPRPDFRKKGKKLRKAKMKNGSKVSMKQRAQKDHREAILNAIASHKSQITPHISAKERLFHHNKIQELEQQLAKHP